MKMAIWDIYQGDALTIDLTKELSDEVLNSVEEIRLNNGNIVHTNDQLIEIIETDSVHPVVLRDGFLSINREFYLANELVVNQFLEKLVRSLKVSSLVISSSVLVTAEVIDGINTNNNIEEIGLGTSESPFVLTTDIYKRFKDNGHITRVDTDAVADELEWEFSSIIGYNMRKKIFGRPIQYMDSSLLIINDLVNESDLELLKMLPIQYLPSEIIFSYRTGFNEENMKRVMEYVASNNLRIEFAVMIGGFYDRLVPSISRNKYKFNYQTFNNPSYYNRLKIIDDRITVDIMLYAKMEDKLNAIIEKIKASSLSPFEKYTYVYNEVKQFKLYKKECSTDGSESRKLHQILFNDYMVCEGFARLLNDLTNRLELPGLKSELIDCVVDNGKEVGELPQGHERVITSIQDEAYQIDGIYISDPTWDNNLEKDLYNFIALTPRETAEHVKMLHMGKIDAFDIDSASEFKTKCEYEDFLLDVLMTLRNLRPNEFSPLNTLPVDDYLGFCNHINKRVSYQEIATMIMRLCNNKIDGFKIMEAAMAVEKFKNPELSSEELKQKMTQKIDDNCEWNKKHFPPLEKTSRDGTVTIIGNAENKFNIKGK